MCRVVRGLNRIFASSVALGNYTFSKNGKVWIPSIVVAVVVIVAVAVCCDSIESNWSEIFNPKLFLRGASREYFSEEGDDKEEDDNSCVCGDDEGINEPDLCWPWTPTREQLEDCEKYVISGRCTVKTRMLL